MADPLATAVPSPTTAPRPTQAPTQTPNPTLLPALRSYRVQETPSGDQMWVSTRSRFVQRALEGIIPGQPVWACSIVVADATAEWGFRFAEQQLTVALGAGADQRTTIRAIAADPAAVAGTTKCIQISGSTEYVEGTPPPTGTPGTPLPTARPTGSGPGPGRPTMTPLPLRSFRINETPGGDQIWISTRNPVVQQQLARITPDRSAWVCGPVIPDTAAEWGFRFDDQRLAVAANVRADFQTTIRAIAANPSSATGTRCIHVGAVPEYVEGTPPGTGTPGTPMPTPTSTSTPGPATATRVFPTRPPRTPFPTRGPSPTPTVVPPPVTRHLLYLPLLIHRM
jgi:hypothetical protein